MSHDSAESNISYNFLVKDDPEVLNPFGDLSSSSSPSDDVLVGPTCGALRTVGIARCFRLQKLPFFLKSH
jgi:hypothetical protein